MDTILFTTVRNERPYPMLHTLQRQKDNSVVLIGCFPGHIFKVGQNYKSDHPCFCPDPKTGKQFWVGEFLEVIEQRDHAGNFDSDFKKTNSYFKIRVSVN